MSRASFNRGDEAFKEAKPLVLIRDKDTFFEQARQAKR
jgi:hypothetical protein